jgi:hypothetical protein
MCVQSTAKRRRRQMRKSRPPKGNKIKRNVDLFAKKGKK